MAASPASDSAFTVASHKGPYRVEFDDAALERIAEVDNAHLIVDARVADLYAEPLAAALGGASVLRIEATEAAKSLDRFPAYVEHLVGHGIRRGHVLVAVGGGILQDIACFLAATLMRGMEWHFVPTTLLAQADSCIGSKSSINVGPIKNVLGTFTPPARVTIAPHVLHTLDEADVRSGIGEMLKVHAIDGPESFDRIADAYGSLSRDDAVMGAFIRASLEIKKRIIELDEFDQGPRNVMNYGHSFGHAIESATSFGVPHGIAVTIGMDMANFASWRLGHGVEEHFARMHPTLRANYAGYEETAIGVDDLVAAIGKDKKNTGAMLRLVLPDADGRIRLVDQPSDDAFRAACAEYLDGVRTA
jgi:3-dehydroquinate synthase